MSRAISISEMMFRNSQADLHPERTPESLEDRYDYLKVTRTPEPDEYGETEQLWGIAKDGSKARLKWEVLYDSLQESTGYDDIPRQWSNAELESDAYGRSIQESQYWRAKFAQSEQENAQNIATIAALNSQIEGQNRHISDLENGHQELRDEITELKRRQPANPNLVAVIPEDPDRRQKRILGGLAIVGAGVIGYLLARHTGFNPTELIAHENAMADQHTQLAKEITSLHATVDQDASAIKQMSSQIAQDTKMMGHLNDHLHNLSKELADKGGSAGSGPKPPAAPATSAPTGRFFVEKGSGIVNEIRQYAHAKGQNISNTKAYDIYRQLKLNFGTRIINLHGTPKNTYIVNGDVRLSNPAWAHWYPKAGEMLSKLIK
jgi:uncharacterized coiled-coil protein SlyX